MCICSTASLGKSFVPNNWGLQCSVILQLSSRFFTIFLSLCFLSCLLWLTPTGRELVMAWGLTSEMHWMCWETPCPSAKSLSKQRTMPCPRIKLDIKEPALWMIYWLLLVFVPGRLRTMNPTSSHKASNPKERFLFAAQWCPLSMSKASTAKTDYQQTKWLHIKQHWAAQKASNNSLIETSGLKCPDIKVSCDLILDSLWFL